MTTDALASPSDPTSLEGGSERLTAEGEESHGNGLSSNFATPTSDPPSTSSQLSKLNINDPINRFDIDSLAKTLQEHEAECTAELQSHMSEVFQIISELEQLVECMAYNQSQALFNDVHEEYNKLREEEDSQGIPISSLKAEREPLPRKSLFTVFPARSQRLELLFQHLLFRLPPHLLRTLS
ncbi:hypothetical protein HK102_011977 [Quaeritorhiza haematococci]|nr:hypothetical protein HK102_011977 [Quaeritorhiza haematococci]